MNAVFDPTNVAFGDVVTSGYGRGCVKTLAAHPTPLGRAQDLSPCHAMRTNCEKTTKQRTMLFLTYNYFWSKIAAHRTKPRAAKRQTLHHLRCVADHWVRTHSDDSPSPVVHVVLVRLYKCFQGVFFCVFNIACCCWSPRPSDFTARSDITSQWREELSELLFGLHRTEVQTLEWHRNLCFRCVQCACVCAFLLANISAVLRRLGLGCRCFYGAR